MNLKALDTIHISSVKADPIRPGEAFSVSDDVGKRLMDRGLAKQVGPTAQKKAPAPRNKKAPAPANKSVEG